MKKMICEICQSSSIRKENGVFHCLDCGTEYSLEEARALLVDADSSSKKSDTIVSNNSTNDYDETECLKAEMASLYAVYLQKDELKAFLTKMQKIKFELEFDSNFNAEYDRYCNSIEVPSKNSLYFCPSLTQKYLDRFWKKADRAIDSYGAINNYLIANNGRFGVKIGFSRTIFTKNTTIGFVDFIVPGKTPVEVAGNLVCYSNSYRKEMGHIAGCYNDRVYMCEISSGQYWKGYELGNRSVCEMLYEDIKFITPLMEAGQYSPIWDKGLKKFIVNGGVQYKYMGAVLPYKKFIEDAGLDKIKVRNISRNAKISLISQSEIGNPVKIRGVYSIIDQTSELIEKIVPDFIAKCKIIPPAYSNNLDFIIKGLYLIQNKRADNIKELINLYETEKWQNKMIEGMDKINNTIAVYGNSILNQLRNLNNLVGKVSEIVVNELGVIADNVGYLSLQLDEINETIKNLELSVDVKIDNKITLY